MKKYAIHNPQIPLTPSAILLILTEITLILLYGGFFETTIALAGVVSALFFCTKKVSLSKSQVLFFLFSIWYLFCSVKNGFVLENTIRGLLPLVILGFWICKSSMGNLCTKIRDIITEASIWIAVISIIHCVASSINSESLIRSTYPFDYSNTSGIYFALCFALANKSCVRFVKKSRWTFAVALLLTQSIGAIGIFVLYFILEEIYSKRFKTLIPVFIILAAGAFLLRWRLLEGAGTFVERILQIHDGFVCMFKNPVFGIGAGTWEHARHYYQTGFYTANTLHSSITSIGVNSGIIGLGLFLTVVFFELRKLTKHPEHLAPVLMILIHSLLDFSMSFIAMDILLLLCLDDVPEESYELHPKIKATTGIILSIVFALFLSGSCSAVFFQRRISSNTPLPEIKNSFSENRILHYSTDAVSCYARLLYTNGKSDFIPEVYNPKYPPTEMIMYISTQTDGGEKFLTDMLKKQPYNTTLRDSIAVSSKKVKKEAELITESAINSLSFPGKILYDLKGENK